ncbi:hypothetical protein GGF38_003717, partial [Coemansia sp. RSA 25]
SPAAEPADSEMAVEEKRPAAFSMPSFQPPTAATTTTGSSMFAAQPAKPTFASGFVPPGAAVAATAPSSSAVVASTTTAESSDDEFFKSIRGLNVSLQKRITDALAANAFVDLTPLLEQYRTHWEKINGTTATTQAPSFDNSRLGAAPVSQPAPVPQAQPAPEPTAVTAPKFSFGSASSTSPSAKPAAATSGFSFNFGKANAPDAATTPTIDSAGESAVAKAPFSFGFGKPKDQATASDTDKKPAFSFGFGGAQQQQKQQPPAAADNDEGSANEDDGEDEEEEEERVPTTAGEEGEITEHQTRAKLYAWDKTLNKYKDLGIGNLKINTRLTDGGTTRARFICRQEGSEKITLNAAMFKKMTVEVADNKRQVGILVISDGLPTRYLVRVKTEAMAQALVSTIERVRDQLPSA